MEKTKQNLLSTDELGFFSGQLALMLQGGIPLYEGVEALYENYKETAYGPAFSTVYEETQLGHSLSGAMEQSGLFPDYAVHMVAVGESTGKIENVLSSLSRHYERESSLRRAVRQSIRYPLVLLCIMAAVVVLLNVKVLPLLGRVLASLGSEASAVASVTMRIGSVLGIVVMVLTFLILVGTILCSFLIRSGRGGPLLDVLGRILPAVGKLRSKISTERFLSVLSLSLSAGSENEAAIAECVEMTEDPATKKKINLILEKVTSGTPLTDALLQSGMLEPLKARMINVGFMTGHSDEVTGHVASLYARDTDEEMERMLGLIEPVLVSILAAVIGCILLSVIIPLSGVMSFLI